MLYSTINKLKEENFGRFFEVGSTARGEENPKDYDVIIVPTLKNKEKWSNVLKLLSQFKMNGKKIDAQIVPSFNPDNVNVYKIYNKYYLSNNKMCKKQTSFINEKQIAKGVDKIPYMKKEL